jgi:hypothetical protein
MGSTAPALTELACLTRAREASADSSEVGQQTDPRHLVEPPAGRRRHLFLAEFVVGRFWSGATMEVGRDG